MHIFKSALHYVKYYKLALNTFQKRNAEIFFKVARLLQALIGNGTHPPPQKKYMHKEKSNYRKNIVCTTLFQVTFFVTFVRNNNVSSNWHQGGWINNLQYVDTAVTKMYQYVYWSFSSQNIRSQLMLQKMESYTGLNEHISGKQIYCLPVPL